MIEMAAKLVTVFVNSSDRLHGKPLYSAIVHLAQEKGIAGATVVRCAEGFGSHHLLHTTRLLELSENLPVRVEIIDVPEKIGPLLTELTAMVGEGLITVSDIRIVRP